eukprot:SAG22_NODE_330_length_12211_cov_6.451948_5_plen_192_part_00
MQPQLHLAVLGAADTEGVLNPEDALVREPPAGTAGVCGRTWARRRPPKGNSDQSLREIVDVSESDSAAGSTRSAETVPAIRADDGTEATGDRFAALRALLQLPEVRSKLDSRDSEGRAALHDAASLVFRDELAEGAGASEESLARAATALRLLLDAGATVTVVDNEGQTPHDVASRCGQTVALGLLSAATK